MNRKQFELMSEKYNLDLNRNEHNYLNHITQLAYDFYCAGIAINLQMAHDVANAAWYMENMRAQSVNGEISQTMRVGACDHVEKLHDIAEKLAGDCVDEVYGNNDTE